MIIIFLISDTYSLKYDSEECLKCPENFICGENGHNIIL